MQSKLKPKDFVLYELVDDAGHTFHFRDYRLPNGQLKQILDIELPDGTKRFKSFVITRENKLRVHKDNKDYIEFLDQHPNNPSSDFFSGVTKFRRYEPEVKLEAEVNSMKAAANAVTEAATLGGNRLFEVAAMLGMFFDKDQTTEALRAVIGIAQAKPNEFLAVYNTPKKEARIRRVAKAAIFHNVINNNSGVYRFGDRTLGVDEDSVVAQLVSDYDLVDLLEARLELTKDAEAEELPAIDKPAISGRGRGRA